MDNPIFLVPALFVIVPIIAIGWVLVFVIRAIADGIDEGAR